MIILSWNARGLGARIKRSTVRSFINHHKPHFVFIQETKVEDFNPRLINSMWKDSQVKWVASPSHGSSGGIISLWSAHFFTLSSSICERNWIAISGEFPSTKFKCTLINVYNPCSIAERSDVWQNIIEFQQSSSLPCLLMGDFNEILDPNERGSLQFSTNGILDFKVFMQELQVLEISASNGKFTWHRGSSKSKLDRLLITPEWLEHFPALKVSLLKRTVSDHCPLLAVSKVKNWGPKPFRFLNCWLSNPQCAKIIQESWGDSKDTSIMDKMKIVKKRLIAWNKTEFGKIHEKIAELEVKIQDLDRIADERNLEEDEISSRKQAQMDLWQWLKIRESYWAQNARSQWIKEGDKNTRYFHAIATMRRRQNCIDQICIGDSTIDDPVLIKKEAISFFSKIFKEEFNNRPTFNGLDFKRLSPEEAQSLVEKFSHGEIDDAVASCDGSKAPGPDGFNFRFIKSSWETIKSDFYNIVQDFWNSARLPRGSNSAFISLIPKVDNPCDFKDYRPISMVGCAYKIIAKLMARRLQKVMNSLIGPQQSSFIKGRQILDGALIASEIIDSCKKSKTEAMMMKLDFHKAFDSVSWKYLDWVLEQMNFPLKWREWIRSCTMSASASLLINGSPSDPFKLHRGLRQGDPLSPFLFNLAVEPLSLLFQKSISLGLWDGIEICRNGSKVSHLQYADDTLVFCPPDMKSLMNIKAVLVLFQLSSGLQVNFHKSSIIGLNVDEPRIQLAAKSLLCKAGSLPFTYLGLPIGGRCSRIALWDPIIEKMRKKLSSWKGSLLSQGGRATLIKASLSNLPLYYMSIFPIPLGVAEKIRKIQSQFFWNGSCEKRRMATVAWPFLENPKNLGGLGFGNLKIKNLGLLAKWFWRYLTDPLSLWRSLIAEKYKYGPQFTIRDISIPSTGGPWKRVCSTILSNPLSKSLIIDGFRKKIGNGLGSSFWHDSWIGNGPLKFFCPRLFLIAELKNATVADNCFWDGLRWSWALTWTRPFRPQDIREHKALIQLLSQVSLSPFDTDAYPWSHHRKGWFSVKSFCFELAKSNPHHLPVMRRELWGGLVPHRIEIFSWLALLGKLNTKAKLVHLGILEASNATCNLCNSAQETNDHLFLHCPVASSLWSWWLSLWNVQWVFPKSTREAFDQWFPPKSGRFFKKIWMASFFIIMWSLWKERNCRCFENVCTPPVRLRELVIIRLCWWLKGWGESFPYGPNEVLRFPQCLDWAPVQLHPKLAQPSKGLALWSPPDPSKYKWNVDASLKLSESKSAIGGVLRDHRGKFICIFSSPIPFMEINHAEIFAIHRAIKLSSSIGFLSQSKVEIESDSQNAVHWCNNKNEGPWNLNFTINYIRNAMCRGRGFEIFFKSRESNVVADLLAKQGLSRADDFVAWL